MLQDRKTWHCLFFSDFLAWIMLNGHPIGRDNDNGINWLCSFFILQCKCWPGFQLKDDGKTCVDIDECSLGFPCSQQCINTYGTYKCLCTDGYEIQPANPNGCKSLSGIELNLSTDPAPVIHMNPRLHSYSYGIHSSLMLLISQNSPLLTLIENPSLWFCVLSTHCSVCNTITVWSCELLSVL